MDLDWRPPPKLVNLQEKVDRGTLDLELSLDLYSGAPRGPRASPGAWVSAGLAKQSDQLYDAGEYILYS